MIDEQLQAAAPKAAGDAWASTQDLLDEVTALVEHARRCTPARSTRSFLDVPQECLILTMRQNQKYFPLFDGDRQAAPTAS